MQNNMQHIDARNHEDRNIGKHLLSTLKKITIIRLSQKRLKNFLDFEKSWAILLNFSNFPLKPRIAKCFWNRSYKDSSSFSATKSSTSISWSPSPLTFFGMTSTFTLLSLTLVLLFSIKYVAYGMHHIVRTRIIENTHRSMQYDFHHLLQPKTRWHLESTPPNRL